MFWSKKREIERLNAIIDDDQKDIDNLLEQLDEKDSYIHELEKKIDKEVMENEKLSNAMKEYGDFKLNNIQIPYYIETRKASIYGLSAYGGGELKRMVEKTKTIPQIVVHYYEEE